MRRNKTFWVTGCDWRDEEPSTGWEVHCRGCCSIVVFSHDLMDALTSIPCACPRCGAPMDAPANPWVEERCGRTWGFGWEVV